MVECDRIERADLVDVNCNGVNDKEDPPQDVVLDENDVAVRGDGEKVSKTSKYGVQPQQGERSKRQYDELGRGVGVL